MAMEGYIDHQYVTYTLSPVAPVPGCRTCTYVLHSSDYCKYLCCSWTSWSQDSTLLGWDRPLVQPCTWHATQLVTCQFRIIVPGLGHCSVTLAIHNRVMGCMRHWHYGNYDTLARCRSIAERLWGDAGQYFWCACLPAAISESQRRAVQDRYVMLCKLILMTNIPFAYKFWCMWLSCLSNPAMPQLHRDVSLLQPPAHLVIASHQHSSVATGTGAGYAHTSVQEDIILRIDTCHGAF